ncbi:MAG: aminotransferase class V-fold PLP-dependent enzyme [Chitinophagaceae bacterium]|nr:aminotransferase class V-fold PLP-dependent enzyme [Chitinophagaceae bacterium]
MKRRQIIKSITLLPLAGGVAGTGLTAAAKAVDDIPKRDILSELGVRTFINAAGTYTMLTGSLMTPEVMEAINAVSKKYVQLDEIQDKVGEKIAALCHAEAATVTAGCWSALVIGMAGVLTGMDSKKVALLPFPEANGMKSEVILQKSHSIGYDKALTNTGVKLITIETREELESAINEKTAMLWFLNREAPKGNIQHEEWIQVAKKHNLPTMIDIAADVPPVENLWKFNDMGFDLVAISGGKALCGPQSAGILMGKKALIDAAKLSASPRSGIARGHKVNKEEIVGMYAALDNYVKRDHAKEWKMWEDRVAVIEKAVKSVPGVSTEVFVPPTDNHTPSMRIMWDPSKVKITKEQLGENLRQGSPSVEVISWEKDENMVRITVFMLQNGEDKIVANRLKEELAKVSA